MPEKLISILLLLGLAACAKQPTHDAPSANSGKSTNASSPASSGSPGSANRGTSAPPTPVHVILAKRQDVPITFQANANVQALSNIELHPQLVSTISRVHVNEGQFVKAGQVLFSLDDKTDQANLARVRAQLARNEAVLQDLQRQHQRSLQLVAQKFVTQSNADTLASQVQAQQAQLQSDKAAIQAAQVNAGYAQVRSPIDGRVGEIKVFPGSLVQLATPLLTVTQINPINLSFTVPESVLPALLAAQKAGPVSVQAKAGGEQGKLVFIDSAVDSQTGTVRVKAQFDNREQKWWPGQYAGVEMVVGMLKDAVVLPQDAIITSVRGQFVYTVEPDQSVKNRPVKIMHSFGQQMAVSGLQGGEKVVLQGKQNLRPGGKVQPVQPVQDKGESGVESKTKSKTESKVESKAESKVEASATAQKGGA